MGAILGVRLDGDGFWPDLDWKKAAHITHGIQLACLPSGTASGQPSVRIRVNLPASRVSVIETAARC